MKNYSIIYYYFLLLIISLPFSVFSQRNPSFSEDNYHLLYHRIQDQYGPDQRLLNGIEYKDLYRNALGHPFFQENRFYNGNLVLRSNLYKNIELKFDIFNQQLIVNYTFNEKQSKIIIPTESISSFSLEGKQFINIPSGNNGKEIYQVIGIDNEIQCLYKWTKTRVESDHLKNVSSYKFSDCQRKSFIFINGKLHRYRGKHSFLKIFPAKQQQLIKKYINSNKINIRKNSNDRIEGLLVYCNEITST